MTEQKKQEIAEYNNRESGLVKQHTPPTPIPSYEKAIEKLTKKRNTHTPKPRETEKNKAYIAQKHVYNDMLQGVPTNNIIKNLMEDNYEIGYNYSLTASREFIRKCYREIKKAYDEEKPYIAESLYTKFMDLYFNLYNENRWSEARQVLDSVAKTFGLVNRNQAQVIIDNGKDENGNDKEIIINFGFND